MKKLIMTLSLLVSPLCADVSVDMTPESAYQAFKDSYSSRINCEAVARAAGVSVDSYRKALLRHAADGGIAEAQHNMGVFLRNEYQAYGNHAVAKDSLHYFTLAAEQGNTYSCTAVGEAYQHGYGVDVSIETAIEWYEKAGAFAHIAMLYLEGKEIAADFEKGRMFLEKALAAGNASAHFIAYKAYSEGLYGYVTNKAKAEEHLRKAADKGHGAASQILSRRQMKKTGFIMLGAVAALIVTMVGKRFISRLRC